MHKLVRAISKTKLSKAARLPSLAGNGLPERMRTTAFAFLGLTAAAGLALVAIFAQLSFHVLTPAPLPDEPVDGSAVAEAMPLHRTPAHVPAVTQRREAPAVAAEELHSAGSNDTGFAPSGAPAPAAPAPSEGGVAPETADGSAPKSTSTTGPASSPPPEETSVPVSEPESSPKPAPTPAHPASPTPVAAPAPGNSQSSSAAAHASDRGVEASSKSTATVEASPPVTSSSPPSSEDSSPGNGKGKALGHAK